MFIIEKEEEKTWAQSRKRLLTSHKIQKAADYFFAIYRVPDISFFPLPQTRMPSLKKELTLHVVLKYHGEVTNIFRRQEITERLIRHSNERMSRI
jgi:hypothetical protein